MENSLLRRKQNRGTDNLATPEEALLPLLRYLPDGILWECATGEGKLADLLEKHGKKVVRGYDFFTDKVPDCAAIITNPPFSLKTKFLERAYELDIPFAFLLPITALEGKRRQKLYQVNDIDLLLLDKRIDFTGKGAPWFAVAWFMHNIKVPNTLNFAKI